MLYIDVVKVDQDVAHVVVYIHVCFKCMFQIFHLFQTMLQVFCLDVAKVDLDVACICMLQAYVLSVSYVCLQVFIWMFHMFTMIFKCFLGVFASVFRRLFQVFHLSSFVCCNCCI